jgi:hypothetical protein
MLELLLVEQLAVREAIDLRPQFRDAVLVGILHMSLARDQAPQHVLAECEIGRGHERPAGHDHEPADDAPERDGSESNLARAEAEAVGAGHGTAHRRPVGVQMAMVMPVTGMRGPGHRRSRADPRIDANDAISTRRS